MSKGKGKNKKTLAFPRGTLTAVFFLSGIAGLGYQVIWGRWLHSVFGASALAVAAVLSAFMAGLALGSYVAGRYGHRLKMDGLTAYGVIEALIGVWALLFPWLIDLVVVVQGRFFFQWVEDTTLYGLIRFFLCFLILLVPTSLMGATYPLLSGYVARWSDAPTRWAGLLYGLNTSGAVVGTLIAGFYLVAKFGLNGSNFILAAVNFVVAAIALMVAKRNPIPSGPDNTLPTVPIPKRKKGQKKESRQDDEDEKKTAEDRPAPYPSRAMYRLIVGLFLVNGIFNLAYEVLWARALALIIGTTTYAFSVMLAVFLTGIAVGSFWMTRRFATLKHPLRVLLMIQVAMSLWVLASPLLVNALPDIFLRLLWAFGINWMSSVLIKSLLCVALLLPLTLGMGAVFPLGIHIAFKGADGLAREVGDLYGINTAGGILGSFAAGFALIPILGVERGIAVTAIGHLLVITALVLFSEPGRRVLVEKKAVWAAALIVALVLPFVARWNPLILASGVYFQPRTFYDPDGNVRLDELMSQATLRYHAEGASATVDVLEAPGGFRALAINGKSVATSNYYDYRLQRLLGILPLLLHPEPKNVLVIGLGTGMTSGAGSIDPSTESLKIVEITGEVVGATESFLEWNLGVVHKPITEVIVEDATHYLRFTPETFDVITSDPIHPFVAGAGDLYSVDNYEVAKTKLNVGGIFCQWVPLYQLDDPDIDSILRTFDEVWDNGTVWVTGKDFVLCGAKDEYIADFETFREKAMQEPYIDILRLLGFWRPEEVLSAYVGRLSSLRDMLKDAVVNTVERPYLEFSAPRAIFLATDAANLQRILVNTEPGPPTFFSNRPPELDAILPAMRPCTELVWQGFVADRAGDLGAATQFARRAFDACPQIGYVRHFAAHTLEAFAGQQRFQQPEAALQMLRRARDLDPYTPAIATALEALEAEVGTPIGEPAPSE